MSKNLFKDSTLLVETLGFGRRNSSTNEVVEAEISAELTVLDVVVQEVTLNDTKTLLILTLARTSWNTLDKVVSSLAKNTMRTSGHGNESAVDVKVLAILVLHNLDLELVASSGMRTNSPS